MLRTAALRTPDPARGSDSLSPGVRGTLYTLEALRGAAALAVVVRHAPAWFGGDLPSLHLAVDLFFVLSGFVIAYAYEARLAAGMSAAQFLTLRLVRLYPLYALGLAVALSVLVASRLAGEAPAWSGWDALGATVLNGLFLPGPTRYGEAFALNMAAWSLFFELVANVAYVLLRRWLSIAVLVGIVAAGACALVGSAWWYGSLNTGWTVDNFAGGFARVAYSFPLGVLLFRLLGRTGARRVSPWLPLGLLVLVLGGSGGNLQGAYEVGAVLFIFPLIVVLGTMSQPATWATPAFAAAGAISYGVYVLHVPLIEWVKFAERRTPGLEIAAAAPWAGVLFMAAVATLAWLLDRVYDGPVRRLWRRRAGGAGAGAAAALNARR